MWMLKGIYRQRVIEYVKGNEAGQRRLEDKGPLASLLPRSVKITMWMPSRGITDSSAPVTAGKKLKR